MFNILLPYDIIYKFYNNLNFFFILNDRRVEYFSWLYLGFHYKYVINKCPSKNMHLKSFETAVGLTCSKVSKYLATEVQQKFVNKKQKCFINVVR